MLYAIRVLGTKYLKFGKAKSVGQRLKDLEVCNPHDLNIEAVANWPDEEERRIHLYLIAAHVRGEWFEDCERAAEVIRLFRDQKLGLERWQAICKRNQVKTAGQLAQEMRAEALVKKLSRAEKSSLLAALASRVSTKPTLIQPSPDMEAASLFMQSLMNLESTTLRSIANSLSTERANGEMPRSAEHS